MAQKSLNDFVVFDDAIGQALSQTDEEETFLEHFNLYLV